MKWIRCEHVRTIKMFCVSLICEKVQLKISWHRSHEFIKMISEELKVYNCGCGGLVLGKKLEKNGAIRRNFFIKIRKNFEK